MFLRFSFDTCTVCDGSSAAPTSQLKNTKSAVKQEEDEEERREQQHVTAALRTYTVRRDFAQNVDQGQKLAREKKSTVANHF